MRRLRRRMPMRRLRLERLWRMRRLWRLLLVNRTLPRLLRRDRVPTRSIDISCYGRVLLDPAHSAFVMTLAAGAANNVDKRRHAGQSMIRKSGNRFSEKIMLHQNARAKSLQSEAISL
jgi:hypothetical protein